MEYYILYKITNLINNKYYNGIHKTNDLDDGYMGSGKRIKNSIEKYGIENFKKEILFYCTSYEELLEKEKEIVNLELINDENCYNIALGGKGSWYHVDYKKGREHANIILKEKYGEDFQKVLGQKGVEVNRINQTGFFDPDFKYSFKNNKEFQKSGTSPEARAKAKITAKKTFQEIKHQQGETNSQYGTCWITKDNENKKIKKEELELWLEQGWSKGRKLKKADFV